MDKNRLQEAVPDGAAAVRYQPYPEYKESNIPWLNELPEHWVGTLFKRYCDIQLGKMLQPNPVSDHDKKVSYLRAVNVQWEQVDTSSVHEMWASPKDIEKFIVKNGDLLVCEGGEVGRSAILKNLTGTCIIQNALHRIKGNVKTNVPFLNYLMRHIADSRWFDILCNKATIAHLTGEKLGAIDLPLPPLSEQQTIAAFLDYKTAKIDALIAKKKALLDKLAEKRTALISHAVTKGLDPNTPMRDSGIDWLGKIPEHWEASRLKFITNKIIDGAHLTPTYISDGIPFLRVTDIVQAQGGAINENNLKFIPENEHIELIKRCKPEKGDLLYSKNGTIGVSRVINWNFDFSIFVSLCLIKVKKELLDSRFLDFSLKGNLTKNQIMIGSKSNTVTNLHLDKIKEFWVTIPPKDEQMKIVDWLEDIDTKMQENMDLVQSVITRLQEYRSALITNAVTGKIDVRNFRHPETEERINHGY